MLKSKNVLGLVPLLLLSFYTYFMFTMYTPKVLAEVREVKGAKSSYFVIPYPKNAIKVASNKTLETEQITLTTEQSIDKAQEFYRNVLIPEDWKTEKISKQEANITTIYKKDDKKIIITTSKQGQNNPNTTVISIEISNN